MSIGAILEKLRADFPDVTVSKIRFLEAEGLISPERTASGYRRFSLHDLERLRFVLTAQRDHYLPLKVIKAKLHDFDTPSAHDSDALSSMNTPRRLLEVTKVLDSPMTRQVRVSIDDVLDRTGISAEFLSELRRANLVSPDNNGFYSDDDIDLISSIISLSKYGIEIRHLRTYKSAADRQADLIAQIAKPRFNKIQDGKARAEDLAKELVIETEKLQKILLKSSLRKSLE